MVIVSRCREIWWQDTRLLNTLWPCGAIWRHRTGWTLAQVMACCLAAPSHYLTQCWLLISVVFFRGQFHRKCSMFLSLIMSFRITNSILHPHFLEPRNVCNICNPSWRHQMETFSALLAICAGNSPVPGEFPAQRPVTRIFIFSLIWVWINDWVSNREAGDLRRYRAHYDVIQMWYVR